MFAESDEGECARPINSNAETTIAPAIRRERPRFYRRIRSRIPAFQAKYSRSTADIIPRTQSHSGVTLRDPINNHSCGGEMSPTTSANSAVAEVTGYSAKEWEQEKPQQKIDMGGAGATHFEMEKKESPLKEGDSSHPRAKSDVSKYRSRSPIYMRREDDFRTWSSFSDYTCATSAP